MTSRLRIRRRAASLRVHDDSADPLTVTEDLARHLRAGSSIVASLRAAQRAHPQLWCRAILRAVDDGASLADAVESRLAGEMRSRRPRSDLVLTLQVVGMAARVGGEPTRHVDALVETLRSRRHAAADRLTHASTAIASIRLLTWLPVACATWMVLDDPSVREVLLASPIGWSCLAAGTIFNLLGRRWTNRLVQRS